VIAAVRAPAGCLSAGDVIRGARSGRVGVVTGSRGGRNSYPSWSLCVLWSGESEPVRLPAVPWDEYELLAQSIDAECDVEGVEP
jgi:hypothetical protein